MGGNCVRRGKTPDKILPQMTLTLEKSMTFLILTKVVRGTKTHHFGVWDCEGTFFTLFTQILTKENNNRKFILKNLQDEY